MPNSLKCTSAKTDPVPRGTDGVLIWDKKRTAQLIALWDEGVTTVEMGRRMGVTKNVIIGKVHRLGLKPRVVYKRAPTTLYGRAEFPGAGRCIFPHGDPRLKGFYFCGEQAPIGQSYCSQHHAITHIKSPPRMTT